MAKRKKKALAPPPPRRSRPPRPAGPPSQKALAQEAAKNEARRTKVRRTLVGAGLGVAAVSAAAGFVVQDRQQSAELRQALTAGSCTVDRESDPISGGSGHVPAPTYSVDPPAGGDHLASSARAGVYAGASLPDDGLLVHALEHGYVVLWHQSDLPEDELAALTAVQEANRGDVMVVERPSLPLPIAATAWNQRLLCGELEVAPIERFVQEYVGQGPEDVARG